MDEEVLKAAMREMGQRGGKRRAESLSTERLAEIGRKAGIKSGKARRKKAAAKRRIAA
jgi:general stress protein YciG